MAKNNYARLKQEADIEAVVNYLGIPVRRKGTSCFLLCPLPGHTDRHATNCYFKPGWNNLYCTACGAAINAIDLIIYKTASKALRSKNKTQYLSLKRCRKKAGQRKKSLLLLQTSKSNKCTTQKRLLVQQSLFNQKLQDFLDYLRDGEISDSEFIQNLDKAVNYASKSSKWREEYDMLLAREQLLIEEGRKEGMAQGMAQGMAESAIKFIKNALRTLSPEEVSKTLDVSLEEVLRVASEKK